MKRQPILPKTDRSWNEDSNAYRKALHEDMYPKDQAWTPETGGVSATSITGSYVRMARMWAFSVTMEAPTTASVGAYIDLPFEVSQSAVFSVVVGGTMKAAIINKGESRLYLPDWTASGRAVISGQAIS